MKIPTKEETLAGLALMAWLTFCALPGGCCLLVGKALTWIGDRWMDFGDGAAK